MPRLVFQILLWYDDNFEKRAKKNNILFNCRLDFVHPDDVAKVREQFNLRTQDSSSNDGNSGRVLDIKTGTIKKDGHGSNTRLGEFSWMTTTE